MKATEIKLDDNFEVEVFSEYLNKEICLCISDDLEASVEELTDEYKEKITCFVNSISQWYSVVCNSIVSWAKDTYKIDAHLQDIKLMYIFVLFEQNEDELFGLGFRAEFDIEHGCGIKIKVSDGKYNIIEVGAYDVAFC
jgi:hypothetical protein